MPADALTYRCRECHASTAICLEGGAVECNCDEERAGLTRFDVTHPDGTVTTHGPRRPALNDREWRDRRLNEAR